jgi:RimJ/RimL family protein N-acetyltransferase
VGAESVDVPSLTTPTMTLAAWRERGQPTVTADGLVLRPWRRDDVDTVVRAYADPSIQQWHVQSKTPDEAREWIARWPGRWDAGTGADWAVATGQDVVVARVGLRSVDLYEGEAEVTYWVLPESRGRHVASRSVDALTRWLFDAGLHRVALRHSTRNPWSCQVADQAGFAWEGTLRRSGRHADGWHDMHLHARVAP